MSEAEIPNNSEPTPSETSSEKLSETLEPHAIPEILLPVAAKPEPEWVTVDFPNAVRVDDIPHAEEPQPDLTSRVQELEQRNQSLLDRIAELEASLEDAKTLLKTETERIETLAGAQYAKAQARSQRQETIIKRQQQDLTFAATRIRDQELQLAAQAEDLTTAQTQVVQLTQDLEQAHQAAQKQQIRVETLTQQLQASQEQVAQFERECAMVQQKYAEQVALVQQAEHTSRDLRSRLQRQQRYTLQFKVALEKCLDVSRAQGVGATDATAEEIHGFCSDSLDLGRLNRHATTDFVKAQPVQPWSSSLFPSFDTADFEPEFVASESSEPELSLDEEDVWATEHELATDGAASLLEELQAAQQAEWQPLTETPAEETKSPSSPFISYTIQKPVPEQSLAAPSEPQSPEMQQFAAFSSAPHSEQASADPNPFAVDEMENFVAEDLEDDGTSEALTETLPETLTMESSALALRETDLEDVPVIESAPEQKSASPFITLNAVPRSTPAETQPQQTPVPTGSGPSPIVYPQRSKKLPSLAAVELPSFPRSK